ncbi:MAG: late competence development ComFB family protein [Pseudanabaena sp. M57BS1SP1A06MG]|nr:late competence development ComFB family protein [Pseudanabaena sp. M53BS1SP1A06MG]MCA6583467.1 late competence development ComFB family protein [Pseudanabaena sp. M34BS1SP1A06MG]MCA6593394.1 late competence development ComFB family protein [Pseudanabaena sp. M38BS1SP1A06MG]MCA6601078.1 late competence development ComFB family protein [Pseudanabaena sp. M57BS1SP1A06MG]
MSSFKNVLEEFAGLAVHDQFNLLITSTHEASNIADVAVFSLNRLPAMYATTKQDLLWRLKKVEQSLLSQLKSLVIQTWLALGRNPRRFAEPTPLLEITFGRYQWCLLGQIYRELFTSPEEAELSLSSSPANEFLIVRALSKQTFGHFADNPRLLVFTTLRDFPSVSEISLCACFLNFPINYSRQKMLADSFWGLDSEVFFNED